MKKIFSSVCAILLLAASAPAATILFDLQGRSGLGMRFNNENPSATGTGTGGENGTGIRYDNVTKILTLNVGWGSGKGFANLTGIVTNAHIHLSADSLFTTNGAVIFNLDGATAGFDSSATNGGWTNTVVTLTAAQETQLLNGQFYLNAHTAANTAGEIRANLVQAPAVPEPASLGLLTLGALTLLRRRCRRA